MRLLRELPDERGGIFTGNEEAPKVASKQGRSDTMRFLIGCC